MNPRKRKRSVHAVASVGKSDGNIEASTLLELICFNVKHVGKYTTENLISGLVGNGGCVRTRRFLYLDFKTISTPSSNIVLYSFLDYSPPLQEFPSQRSARHQSLLQDRRR